jgi:L-ribulose-5-phosphate 4-epimerase
MRSHGVFTIGKDARAAVKAAVMCEDVARSVYLSRQLGEPLPIPADDIDRLYHRYQNVYGQQEKQLFIIFITFNGKYPF